MEIVDLQSSPFDHNKSCYMIKLYDYIIIYDIEHL